MKRLNTKACYLALLALLCLCFSACAEEDSFGTYIQPEGVQVCEIRDLHYFPAPAGLDSMYALMSRNGGYGDLYAFVTPNGRALLTVSRMDAPEPGSAQSLADQWPQIALALQNEAKEVDVDPSCLTLENQYGFDAIHIRTRMTLEGEVPLAVEADGVAFYQDQSLMELWMVWPEETLYESDPQAAGELKEDLLALEELKASFDFGQGDGAQDEALEQSAVSYADPQGAFCLKLPPQALIVSPAQGPEEAAAAREAFAALGEDYGGIFDLLYEDVTQEGATLLLLPESGLACQLFCQKEEAFAKATLSTYYQLAEPVRASLEKRFGSARLLDGDGTMEVSGLEHAWLSYWLRTGKTDLLLNVLAVTDGEGRLREIDLYTFPDAPGTGPEKLLRLMLDTLEYLPGTEKI